MTAQMNIYKCLQIYNFIIDDPFNNFKTVNIKIWPHLPLSFLSYLNICSRERTVNLLKPISMSNSILLYNYRLTKHLSMEQHRILANWLVDWLADSLLLNYFAGWLADWLEILKLPLHLGSYIILEAHHCYLHYLLSQTTT